MGYYSDVAIRCTKSVYERLEQVIKEFEFYPDKVFRGDNGNMMDRYTLIWYNTKWYRNDEYFPEIKEIHKVLDSFEHSSEDKEGWYFVRLGEGEDDTETMWADYWEDCVIPIWRQFGVGMGVNINIRN